MTPRRTSIARTGDRRRPETTEEELSTIATKRTQQTNRQTRRTLALTAIGVILGLMLIGAAPASAQDSVIDIDHQDRLDGTSCPFQGNSGHLEITNTTNQTLTHLDARRLRSPEPPLSFSDPVELVARPALTTTVPLCRADVLNVFSL